MLDSVKCSFVFVLAYLGLCQCSVTSDFALVLGAVGVGSLCPPLFRDPHPTCARCRGVKCTADVTCDICKDWSVAQWEVFLKHRPYSGRRKNCPSPCITDPSALRLGFFGNRTPCAPSSVAPPPLLLMGVVARRKWRVSTGWVLASPPPPTLPFCCRRERGEAPRGPWLLRVRAILLLPLFRGRG